jgi:excisionase family DNA binding protein
MQGEVSRNSAHGRLLNAEEAGALLNVPHTWVLTEARHDRIPHIRLGRYVRFDRDELVAWARARQRGPVRRTQSGEEN